MIKTRVIEEIKGDGTRTFYGTITATTSVIQIYFVWCDGFGEIFNLTLDNEGATFETFNAAAEATKKAEILVLKRLTVETKTHDL